MYINTQVKIISRSNRNTYVGYIFSEWRLCDTLLTDLLYNNTGFSWNVNHNGEKGGLRNCKYYLIVIR